MQGCPARVTKGTCGEPLALAIPEMHQLNKKNPESVRLNQVESLMLMQDLTLPDTILSCTGSH